MSYSPTTDKDESVLLFEKALVEDLEIPQACAICMLCHDDERLPVQMMQQMDALDRHVQLKGAQIQEMLPKMKRPHVFGVVVKFRAKLALVHHSLPLKCGHWVAILVRKLWMDQTHVFDSFVNGWL